MTAATESPDPPAIKLAVIGPSFFSYVNAIVAEFERRGIAATVFDERHSNSVLDKILYRTGFHHNRFSPKHKHLAFLIDEIRLGGITDVLLVDVEVSDRPFVERLRGIGVRVHLYMWDGVHNKPGFVHYLDLVTSKGTFDPTDASALEMEYIPLFAENVFEAAPAPTEAYQFDIGFCGTLHSSRSRIIAAMLDSEWGRRRKFALLLYYHSRKLFLLKGLLSRSAWRFTKLVSDKSFSKQQIAKMFSQSRFILDVPHWGQTGMTARTFEVLLAGSRLLTFNPLARDLLPASLQPRIHVIDDIAKAGEIDFDRCERFPPLDETERYFLSINRFVDQLIGMMGLSTDYLSNRAERRIPDQKTLVAGAAPH